MYVCNRYNETRGRRNNGAIGLTGIIPSGTKPQPLKYIEFSHHSPPLVIFMLITTADYNNYIIGFNCVHEFLFNFRAHYVQYSSYYYYSSGVAT